MEGMTWFVKMIQFWLKIINCFLIVVQNQYHDDDKNDLAMEMNEKLKGLAYYKPTPGIDEDHNYDKTTHSDQSTYSAVRRLLHPYFEVGI